MRGVLIAFGAAVAAFGVTSAPAMQRVPTTFIPPEIGDERFLESWFGAELRTAGYSPLWTARGLDGYRERYRLSFAAGGAGVTIVTIDVDHDGSGVVTATRKRPGGIVERNQRALYIPGRIARSEQFWIDRGSIRHLRRMFESQNFFGRSFRSAVMPGEEQAVKCSDGVSYLVEMRDRTGYHAITRDNCDVDDVRTLIDAVMKIGGGWPRHEA